MRAPYREYNLDGLIGPTHNYGGLSPGNLASTSHGGRFSNPRAAALQGLAKARFVHNLGVGQGFLPPQERPNLRTLRRLGFWGTDEEVLVRAAKDEHLLRLCSSAASMWTANAATVAPSIDTGDHRVHLTPANLQQMFHRAIEPETTLSVLRTIFGDPAHFVVHDPLPGGGQFADEGAANHVRLEARAPAQTHIRRAVHLFAWGRSAYRPPTGDGPFKYPARQTLEASQALARLHQLPKERCLFPRQDPRGIDAGGFHTDVLAVGNEDLLLVHELAFVNWPELKATLADLLGDGLKVVFATDKELPVNEAVAAYPFNSQVLSLADGSMVIVAPLEAKESPLAHAYLSRVAEDKSTHVKAIHYLDVRQSMDNGGGPACLRLRIPLNEAEVCAMNGRVLATDELFRQLEDWIGRRYRDRLVPADLADPQLHREGLEALDELTQILDLGNLYDFQRSGLSPS